MNWWFIHQICEKHKIACLLNFWNHMSQKWKRAFPHAAAYLGLNESEWDVWSEQLLYVVPFRPNAHLKIFCLKPCLISWVWFPHWCRNSGHREHISGHGAVTLKMQIHMRTEKSYGSSLILPFFPLRLTDTSGFTLSTEDGNVLSKLKNYSIGGAVIPVTFQKKNVDIAFAPGLCCDWPALQNWESKRGLDFSPKRLFVVCSTTIFDHFPCLQLRALL